MKKNVFGRKLGRDKNERQALFKSLMSSLVLHEKIKTSESKAKAIRPEIEKLVTKAKKGQNGAKKILEKSLSKSAFEKMLKDIGPRFAQRPGGYTRIVKLGRRLGDDSQTVLMEWVESSKIVLIPEETQIKETKKEKPLKKPAKKETKVKLKSKPKVIKKAKTTKKSK